MKKSITHIVFAGVCCGTIALLSSCTDAKCVSCDAEIGGQSSSFHECYGTNKEAREALEKQTEEYNKLSQAYGGSYKCSRGKN